MSGKITALLLALMLTAGMLVSCGGSADTAETTTAAANEISDTAETTTAQLTDSLPERDFGGKDFIFVTRDTASSWLNPIIAAESLNGEVLNDAVFTRNRSVEERFNVSIIQNSKPSGDRDGLTRNAILAGDSGLFDVVLITDRTALVFAQEGLLIPWSELTYIDLDMPWWSQTLNEQLSIAGNMYFAYGDFNLIPYDYTHMLIYNKQMGGNLGLELPYSLVLGNKWTYDVYAEYAVAALADLNGDGKMDGNDSFGLLSQAKHVLPCFWISADVLSVTKDADDLPVFDLSGDEQFFNVIEKIFIITYDNGTWNADKGTNNTSTDNENKFIAGQGLFLDSTFNNVKRLRNMDADFSILPYPMWDEAQDGCRSRVEGGDLPMVTVINDDLDLTAYMLEALSCESWKTTIPAYYEIALKGKNTRDAESEEMMDIIYNNRVYDLGDTYWCNQLRDGIFLQMFQSNDRDLASKIAGVQNTMDNEIKKTVDAFASLG